MVADLTGGEDRERAYGLLKAANNLGFGMGFVTGGVLYGIANVAVFVVDGATSGVVAIILLVLLPRTIPDGAPTALRDDIGQLGRAIGEPRLVHLALLNVIFAIAYAQMQSTVPVFVTETLGVTSEELGTLFVLNPLVIVLFQLPMVSWVARWRRTRGLLLSTVFWAVSFAAIILANTGPRFFGIAMIGAFLVLRTMGEILHSPLATSIASDLGSAAERGSQLSMVEIAKRLGFGIGPLVGGAFFDAGLESLLWPVLIGMCGLLALGVLLLERRITPAENGLSSA
jgi:predicted MFS family arabinose efflux permease